MKASLAALCLIAVLGPARLAAQSTRVFFGDTAHPVASGEVWLVAHSWGFYPGVRLATISTGKLRLPARVDFPRDWSKVGDYGLIVGISSKRLPPGRTKMDSPYATGPGGGYWARFSTLYTAKMSGKTGNFWLNGLNLIARETAAGLVLPLPKRRTIRMLYPDGHPLVGRSFFVMLFGTQQNHCGVSAGIPVGSFATDANGQISFVATAAELSLTGRYYEEHPGGPAGTTFTAAMDLVTSGDQAITLREFWTLPTYDYRVSFEEPDGKPLAGVRLGQCLRIAGCGANCGTPTYSSDASGILRFKAEDLRSLERIAAADPRGRKRELSDAEMRELLTTHGLKMTWDFYRSPDGGLIATVTPACRRQGLERTESGVEIRDARGRLAFSKSYGSADCEHGSEVMSGKWTPDSQFFVFSTHASGGHQPWHYPTYAYVRCSNEIVEVRPSAPIVTPEAVLYENDRLSAEVSDSPGTNQRRGEIIDLRTLVPCAASAPSAQKSRDDPLY